MVLEYMSVLHKQSSLVVASAAARAAFIGQLRFLNARLEASPLILLHSLATSDSATSFQNYLCLIHGRLYSN